MVAFLKRWQDVIYMAGGGFVVLVLSEMTANKELSTVGFWMLVAGLVIWMLRLRK
jgi:hypothetical protein